MSEVKWKDIESDSRYINADAETQQKMQGAYFDKYVKPTAEQNGLDVEQTRMAFYQRISPAQPSEKTQSVAINTNETLQKEHSENQAFYKTLFTEDELKSFKDNPIGFFDIGKFLSSEDIPLTGTGETAFKYKKLNDIKKFLDDGHTMDELDITSKQYLTDFLRLEGEKELRGFSTIGGIAYGVSKVPSFAVEFALSGGVVGLTKGGIKTAVKAGIKTGVKTAIKEATEKAIVGEAKKELIKETATALGKQAFKDMLKKRAVQVATVPIFKPSLYTNYQSRQFMQGVDITDKGQAIFKEAEESPLKSMLMCYAGSSAESFSEITGGAVSGAVGKITSPLFKSATRYIPESVKVALYNGYKTLKPNARVSQFLSREGWNGFVGEYGEEEIENILQTGVSLAGGDITTEKALEQLKGTTEDRLQTLGVLLTLQGMSVGTSATINHLMKKGATKAEAETGAQELSETEKDKIALETNPDPVGSFTIDTIKTDVSDIKSGGIIEKNNDTLKELDDFGKTNALRTLVENASNSETLSEILDYIEKLEYQDTNLLYDISQSTVADEQTKAKAKELYENTFKEKEVGYDLDAVSSTSIQAGVDRSVMEQEDKTNPPNIDNKDSSFGLVRWLKNFKKDFVYNWVNSKKQLELLGKDIKIGIRNYYGIVGRINTYLKTGFYEEQDGRLVKTGKSFKEILDDYDNTVMDVERNRGERLKDFSDYLVARRYLFDLKDREDVEVTPEQLSKSQEDLQRLQAKYGDKYQWFDVFSKELVEFQHKILHKLVDSGNMSQEQYDEILKNNPNYIPFDRIMDEDGNIVYTGKGKFTSAKSPVKKIRGSEREIKNVFQSIVNNTAKVITVAERNTIAKQIADAMVQVGEAKQVPPQMIKKGTAKVKVSFDAKMRRQLQDVIKKFGRTFENVKSIRGGRGLTLGAYSELEQKVLKRLGSQDRTLAHEVGHMIDYALGLEKKLSSNKKVMEELRKLAEDRLSSVVTLKEGGFEVSLENKESEKFKNYIFSNKEMLANMFDLYITSRDYVKQVVPNTAKVLDDLFTGDLAFIKDIRPSSETGIEEIEQDVWGESPYAPKNTIAVYENGKRKYYEIGNKDILREIEDTDKNVTGFVTKLLQAPSTLLRRGATEWNPDFVLRNPLRDIQSAIIQLTITTPKDIIKSPKQWIKAVFDVIGGSDLYKERIAAGGGFESFLGLSEEGAKKNYEEFYNEMFNEKGKFFQKINPFYWVSKAGEIGEQATRQMIYNTAIEQGYSSAEASYISRDTTLDFAVSGKQGKFWNRYIPFLNASIRGTATMIEKTKENPMLFLRKALITQTIPTVLLTGYYLFAASDDDRKEYLELPEWRRHTGFNFKVGDNWWYIPKAFALGEVFSTPIEQAMIMSFAKDRPESKNLFLETVKGIAGSVTPVQDIGAVMPPLLKWAVESASNYNFFTGRRIYPEYMDSYVPSMRYNRTTSETSKLIGEKLNMSPAMLDNTIRSFTGGTGGYVLDASDKIIKQFKEWNGEKVPAKPSSLRDIPVIRGFVVPTPIGSASQSLNMFYENINELKEYNATYNKLKGKEKQDFYKEHREEINSYNVMKSYEKQLKSLRDYEKQIYDNKTMSAEEKRKQLDVIDKRMTSVASKANEVLKKTKK